MVETLFSISVKFVPGVFFSVLQNGMTCIDVAHRLGMRQSLEVTPLLVCNCAPSVVQKIKL